MSDYHFTVTALKKLYCAVIERTIRDLNLKDYRSEAYKWINDEYCEELCEFVGLNYEFIKDKAAKIVSQFKTKGTE